MESTEVKSIVIDHITLKNGEEVVIQPAYKEPDYSKMYLDNPIIHIYKHKLTDEKIVVHIMDYDQQEHGGLTTQYGFFRKLDYAKQKELRLHPEKLLKEFPDFIHWGTITIDQEDFNRFYTRSKTHSYSYSTHTYGSSFISNRLIDAYIEAYCEVWRMSGLDDKKHGNDPHYKITFKINCDCNTCHGSGIVYYRRGKRIIKRIVRKCPQCKGKESSIRII